MKRGVIYFTWGKKVDKTFIRSVKSIRETNPELKICWFTDTRDVVNEKLFDVVLPIESKEKFGWHRRTETLLQTPFESTLQLDTDTIIRGDLTYGFEKCEKHGMALSHAPACHSVFVTNTSNGSLLPISEGQPIYNAGVIFYTLNDEVKQLINTWMLHNQKCKTEQDQGGLSNAMEELNFNPFVLTRNWNFRGGLYKTSYGPIKIWHHRDDFYGDNETGFYGL